MGRYLQVYDIIRRNFGATFKPVATYGLLQTRKVVSSLGLLLDHVAYPGFRNREIRAPVFIIGTPRSGTTFLHKHLESTGGLCGFELWEMMFPAITSRKVLSPFIERASVFNPAKYHANEAHETSLRGLETDDVLEFMNFFDGGIIWAYFLAWEDQWGSDQCLRLFDPALQEPRKKERLYRYLDACWRRNMHYKDCDRIVVKSSMLIFRIAELLERYPDCRFIYTVRDPMETIPSAMSLFSGALVKAFDVFNRAGEEATVRYKENLYRAACHFYRAFHDAREAGVVPEDQLFVVPFPRLMTDLEQVTKELLDFIEVEPTPEFLEQLVAKAERQKEWKSGHTYSLDTFGLDEERLRSDLSFVYNTCDVV